MKQIFSTKWKASKQVRKQRKYIFNLPLHLQNKLMSSHLEKTLRTKYGRRSIAVRNDAGRLFLNIEGGKSAMLIGRRGQTLEALQYIVDKVVNKQSGYRIRVQIGINTFYKRLILILRERH